MIPSPPNHDIGKLMQVLCDGAEAGLHGRPIPMKINPNDAKRAIEMFEAAGHTSHSGRGDLLWAVLNHCETNRIPYQLKAHPGNGYFIEKIAPMAEVPESGRLYRPGRKWPKTSEGAQAQLPPPESEKG